MLSESSRLMNNLKLSIVILITISLFITILNTIPVTDRTDNFEFKIVEGGDLKPVPQPQNDNDLPNYGTRAGAAPRIVIIPEGGNLTYQTLLTNLGYSFQLAPNGSPGATWLQNNADIVIQDDYGGTFMSAAEVTTFQTAYNNGVTFWFSVDDLSTQSTYAAQMQTLCGINSFSDNPDASLDTVIFNQAAYPNGCPTNVNGLSLDFRQSDQESVTVNTAKYLDSANPGHYATILDGGTKFVLYLGDTIDSVSSLGPSGTLGKLMNSYIQMWISTQIGDLILEDGGGLNSDTCFAMYKAYTFNATVAATYGLTNVSYVNITLDYGPGEENLQFSWNCELDDFTEINDPNNYTEINSTSADSTNNKVDEWYLNFKIRFNWSYPDEQLSDCALNITHSNNNKNNSMSYKVFRVENDMMFRGQLSVVGQYQGALSNGDWVIGSELLNWTGYRVVYQGSLIDYVNGSYYNVSITDDDTGSWNDSPATGESINLTTQADAVNDPADVHEIDIVELPNGSLDKSNKNFMVRVDTINVTFSNPVPASSGWASSTTPTCKITINDTDGSGVNVSSIEYRNSTNGSANYGPWQSAGLSGSGKSYIASANPSFIVGSNNSIQWRALDAVGNGYNSSGDIQVKVELAPPDNSIAKIVIEGGAAYSNDTTLDFTWENFTDSGGSGLAGYYYSFENNETTPNGTWDDGSPGALENAAQGPVAVYVWAHDNAGNIGDSVNDTIFVDSKKPNFVNILPTPGQWQKTATVACSLQIDDTGLGSGINISSIEYRITTSGIPNYSGWTSAGASGSGTFIPVTVNPTFAEGTDNYIQWRAKDIVDYQRVSGHNQVKIDLTDISYSNPQPTLWQTSRSVTCGIKIDDIGGSGVDTSTIEYAVSTNGPSGYGNWINLGRSGVLESIYCYATETFVEGTNNYIKWRATDLADNQNEIVDLQIKVDSMNITFTNPIPSSDTIWQRTSIVDCSITVNDFGGSFVNATSISYKYSTFGIGNYSEWISAQETDNGEIIICTAVVQFYDGDDNYIKWGAKDIAGNWYESPDLIVNVDTGNLTFSNAQPRFYEWNTVDEVQCSINIKDTGYSGIDYSSIEYQIQTSECLEFDDWQTVDSTDITGTSSDVVVQVAPIFTEGTENYIRWRTADIAGNAVESGTYKILVDTGSVYFEDPLPLMSQTGSGWEHSLTVTCGITVSDAVSGVDATTIEYSVSTAGPLEEYYCDWTSHKKLKDGASLICSIDVPFTEGENNYIRWRAKDVAANDHTVSDAYQLKIDTQNIEYTSALPTAEEWQTEMPVEFKITIEDNYDGSGINLSSIKYCISTCGISGYSELDYGDWYDADNDPNSKLVKTQNGLSCIFTVDLTLPDGKNNHLKLYAEDYAGNGLESQDYQIVVDTQGAIFSNPYPSPARWQTGGTKLKCEITIADQGESNSNSELDLGTLEYCFSKTGLKGFGTWQNNWEDISSSSGRADSNSMGELRLTTPNLAFVEGADNYIKWRTYDNAGNYQESEVYPINIDTNELTYLDARIVSKTPIDAGEKLSFTFEITLDDTGGSGVDISTIEHAISNQGILNYGVWKSLWEGTAISEIPAAREVYAATITETVDDIGGEIYIKLRAKDVAGNGYTESENGLILGNSVPVPIISSPNDGDRFYKDDAIEFDAAGSTDDELERLEYAWISNISGEFGSESEFRKSLEPGQHKITLKVSDGYNPEVSTSVTITVKSDSKEAPGLFEDNTGIAIIVSLVVIIVIIALLFLLIIRRKKKLLAEEEKLAREELAASKVGTSAATTAAAVTGSTGVGVQQPPPSLSAGGPTVAVSSVPEKEGALKQPEQKPPLPKLDQIEEEPETKQEEEPSKKPEKPEEPPMKPEPEKVPSSKPQVPKIKPKLKPKVKPKVKPPAQPKLNPKIKE